MDMQAAVTMGMLSLHRTSLLKSKIFPLLRMEGPNSHFYDKNFRLSLLCVLKCAFKAAYSVTFDLQILKLFFLFFKNTVKILKFR